MGDHPSTVAAALDGSLELLRQEGWGQDNYYRPVDGYCSVGAIHKVACGCDHEDELENIEYRVDTCTGVFVRTVAHMSKTLREHTDFVDGDIIEWNDDRHQDFDHVVEMFEVARDAARSWFEDVPCPD